MTTVLGSLLDPIADKLLMASALICLVERHVVASWIAIIIIGREIAVTGFRAIAASQGLNIPASNWGKLKMTLEVIIISILILGPGYLGMLYKLAQTVGLWLIVAMALFSAVEYFARFGLRVLLRIHHPDCACLNFSSEAISSILCRAGGLGQRRRFFLACR